MTEARGTATMPGTVAAVLLMPSRKEEYFGDRSTWFIPLPDVAADYGKPFAFQSRWGEALSVLP